MDANEALPWERQKGESRQAFRAFVIYRDMGREGRGSGAVAKQYGCHNSLAERWCTRWRWVERIAAYDAEQDRVAREAFEQERLEARKARLGWAGSVLTGAERTGDKFLRLTEGKDMDAVTLASVDIYSKDDQGRALAVRRPGIGDLLRAMGPAVAEAIKTQRLDYGEATDRTEQTGILRLEHEHKYVEDFGSELDALGRDLGALGLDPGTIEALQGAIVASDAGTEGGGEGGAEPGEPG